MSETKKRDWRQFVFLEGPRESVDELLKWYVGWTLAELRDVTVSGGIVLRRVELWGPSGARRQKEEQAREDV